MSKRFYALALTLMGALTLYTTPMQARVRTHQPNDDITCQSQCSNTCSQEEGFKCKRSRKHGNRHGKKDCLGKLTKQLSLTAEQQEKAKPIIKAFQEQNRIRMNERRAVMEHLLTPEQKASLEGIKKNGQCQPKIELSNEQQTKLDNARLQGEAQRKKDIQEFKLQMDKILSAEQQQRLAEILDKPQRSGGCGNCPRKCGQLDTGTPGCGSRMGNGRDQNCMSNKRSCSPRTGGCQVMEPGPDTPTPAMFMTRRFTKELDLTPAQQQAILPILQKHEQAMKQAQQSLKAELKDVLTQEQMTKLESSFRPGESCGSRPEHKCAKASQAKHECAGCGK